MDNVPDAAAVRCHIDDSFIYSKLLVAADIIGFYDSPEIFAAISEMAALRAVTDDFVAIAIFAT